MSQIVHPAEIESRLASIWDSFQGTNKMRACLFNLIIYTQQGPRTTYLTQVAEKVIEKFPSRIIFITCEEKEVEEELKTAVSVLTAEKGDNAIACDLIEVSASSKSHPRIPFVILPHILPDLPIYLVYADDPARESTITQKLCNLANRIIFDSEVATDLPLFAKALLAKKKEGHADIADLNWARIEGWRHLFANVFKAADDLSLLQRTNSLCIQFNSKITSSLTHAATQSIYLQAWLACQLNWKLQTIERKDKALCFLYESSSHKITVSLKPMEASSIAPGRIINIAIEETQKWQYHFTRNLERPHHIHIEKSTSSVCSLPTTFILEKDVFGQSLVNEICHQGSSQHYLKMLYLLAETDFQPLGL